MRALPKWVGRVFEKFYPNARVVINGAELVTEMQGFCQSHSAKFSDYKHHNTAKAFVRRAAPSGLITFFVDVYAGRSTGKQITNIVTFHIW